MKIIKEEKLNKTIKKKEFKWNFEIEEDGIYGIEITALAKSWQQNFPSLKFFFGDDDLTIKIDNLDFPRKSGKRGLFDGEIAWNGNNLKGLKKTDLFLIKLDSGNHTLIFLADQKPKIEIIKIYKLVLSKVEGINEEEISYLPKDNYPIQDGNRRQWLTIVLCNLFLKSLFIKASVKKRERYQIFNRDDEDLKLIINNQIQKNQEPKSHKYWYWCGRILKGKTKIFEKELNLKPGLLYLELWADRSPEIEEIKIIIKKPKRIPTVDSPKWTGNFEDDSEQMILARIIYGEARSESREAKAAVGWSVRHRVEMKVFGGDTYYAVILKPNQYASFREVDENYDYVIDPLHKNNPIDEKAWRKSYEIAGQVIKGEIEDFSEGANFFHDVSLPQEDFLKIVPGARFIKRIGLLLFYFNER
jgi:hypothetical protein